jgi:hypothetical protein
MNPPVVLPSGFPDIASIQLFHRPNAITVMMPAMRNCGVPWLLRSLTKESACYPTGWTVGSAKTENAYPAGNAAASRLRGRCSAAPRGCYWTNRRRGSIARQNAAS